MEITIRTARPDDAATIVALIEQHAAIDGETTPLGPAYVSQYLASPGSEILLAETNAAVVGLLSWSHRPDLFHAGEACLIEELIVQEGHRDQGIGGALLNELFKRLGDRNPAEVSVAVMPANSGAIKFYNAHGLREEALLLEMHLAEHVTGFSAQ